MTDDHPTPEDYFNRAQRAEQECAELREEIEQLREALNLLFSAVCGETGFAEAVRRDSGKAYPWPALAIAEEAALEMLENRDD